MIKFFAPLFLMASSLQANAGVATIEKWERNVLSVCWFTGKVPIAPEFRFEFGDNVVSALQPAPDRYRKIIQNAVMNEYTLEKVGIEFTGWEECNRVQTADIQITFASSSDVTIPSLFHVEEGMAEGGVSSHIGREQLRTGKLTELGANQQLFIHISFFDLNQILMENPLRREIFDNYLVHIGLHEFGHMAGLMHEDRNSTLKSGVAPRRYTPKDRFSVMTTLSMIATQLSPGDVHTLRCLYLYEIENRVNPCKLVSTAAAEL